MGKTYRFNKQDGYGNDKQFRDFKKKLKKQIKNERRREKEQQEYVK